MDQCKHCIVKGDIAACEQTVCDKHEYWYTMALSARVTRLEEALKLMLDAHGNTNVMPTEQARRENEIAKLARRALEEK